VTSSPDESLGLLVADAAPLNTSVITRCCDDRLSPPMRYNGTAKPFDWRYTKTDLDAYLDRLAAHESLAA